MQMPKNQGRVSCILSKNLLLPSENVAEVLSVKLLVVCAPPLGHLQVQAMDVVVGALSIMFIIPRWSGFILKGLEKDIYNIKIWNPCYTFPFSIFSYPTLQALLCVPITLWPPFYIDMSRWNA